MPEQRQKYESQIFSAFKGLVPHDYYALISYFEKHEQTIVYLEPDEYFEMLVSYCDALFQTGDYFKFNKVVPAAIESTILYNIKTHQDRDIFQELLFKKAASHYHLREFEKAEYVLLELVKIDPSNELNSRFLKKCLYRNKPRFIRDTRAISICIFLLSSLVIAFEILLVRNFFKLQQADFEMTRNLLFASGWLVLISGELVHYWRVGRKVDFFKRKVKRAKHGQQPLEKILEEA